MSRASFAGRTLKGFFLLWLLVTYYCVIEALSRASTGGSSARKPLFLVN